jgi:hypothetical protein
MALPRVASLLGGSVFLGLALSLVGCGGPTKGKVSGTVTYGDKTVKSGQVFLYGGDGAVVSADINPDGSYVVVGVATGEATACVVAANPADNRGGGAGKDRKLPEGVKQDNSAEKKIDPKDIIAIHPDYASPLTSGMKFTISSSDHKYDIKMTKK